MRCLPHPVGLPALFGPWDERGHEKGGHSTASSTLALVRKISAPGNPEFAVGSVAESGVDDFSQVTDDEVVTILADRDRVDLTV